MTSCTLYSHWIQHHRYSCKGEELIEYFHLIVIFSDWSLNPIGQSWGNGSHLDLPAKSGEWKVKQIWIDLTHFETTETAVFHSLAQEFPSAPTKKAPSSWHTVLTVAEWPARTCTDRAVDTSLDGVQPGEMHNKWRVSAKKGGDFILLWLLLLTYWQIAIWFGISGMLCHISTYINHPINAHNLMASVMIKAKSHQDFAGPLFLPEASRRPSIIVVYNHEYSFCNTLNRGLSGKGDWKLQQLLHNFQPLAFSVSLSYFSVGPSVSFPFIPRTRPSSPAEGIRNVDAKCRPGNASGHNPWMKHLRYLLL